MVAGPRDSGDAGDERVRKAAPSGPRVDFDSSVPQGASFPGQWPDEVVVPGQGGESGNGGLSPAHRETPSAESGAEGLTEPAVEPQELRPRRKLRIWQLAPIVVFAVLGSLMFAFPLAFEPGGSSGAVVSTLGLLLFGCGAGGAVVAARRVGHRWPGLPAGGDGSRPDWRVVALYALLLCTVVALAVLRIARLR